MTDGLDPKTFLKCYARRGLYCPTTRRRLAPVWHRAVRNWRRARLSQDELLRMRHHEVPSSGLASFRSTQTSWSMSPVVPPRSLLAASAVLLSDAALRAHPEQSANDLAFHSWLGPTDRFTRKILGSIQNPLGLDRCSIETLSHVSVRRELSTSEEKGIHTCTVQPGDVCRRDDLTEMAWAARGRVFAVAEELEDDDLHLEALDERYRRVDLRRHRKIWLAYSLRPGRGARPVGAAIAYHGPLGLDLRFLENRCELLVHPGLGASSIASVAKALLRDVARWSDRLSHEHVPVLVDRRTAAVLERAGAQRRADYQLAIVLRSAYADWCRYLAQAHAKLSRARAT